VLRAVVPPLVTAYAVFVAMVLVARRHPAPRPGRGPSSGAPRAGVVGTTLGGYVVFLAMVLVFHVWLAGERNALASAAWSGAFLSTVALAAGAISGIITRRRTRHG
jgi:hypothetical protein